MAKKTVLVISLRPHIERCRRATDEKYWVDPQRLPRLKRLGYARLFDEVVDEAHAEAVEAVEQEAAADAAETDELAGLDLDELLARWTPKMDPADYLRRHPGKGHAKLAQFITEKLAQGDESDDKQDEAT
jgi:hypothetical protein